MFTLYVYESKEQIKLICQTNLSQVWTVNLNVCSFS